MWFSSNGYLVQAFKQDLEDFEKGLIDEIPYKKFTSDDGFPLTRLSYGNSSLTKKLSNGEIAIASKRGVIVIDPIIANTSGDAFFPYIDRFFVDDVSRNTNGRVGLTPKDKRIEIPYSALNIRAPKKTRFRIKLSGIDEDWVYVGERTSAYYDYLPDGENTFSVSAIGPDGLWSDKTASIDFTVLPPFYKTWWFGLLCLFAFGGSVAGSVQWRSNKKLRELNRELEYQHKIQQERERISRDLHDNVGSQITNLITGIEIGSLHNEKSNSDEVAKILESLDAEARNTMTDLRETFWLLDKEEVPFSAFSEHLRGYLKRQKQFLGTMEVEISKNVPDALVLNPTQSLNLMRIIQETLNNARKYAEATRFEIGCKWESDNLTISLSDNGKGMDMDESSH
jgi:signal transduction histidine kinase